MTFVPTAPQLRQDDGIYQYENALKNAGAKWIAGVDEAGRGACAGPLVAAAVVLDEPIAGVADSKLLRPKVRAELFETIYERAAAVEVVIVGPAEIDEIGIQAANISALRRAVARLAINVDFVLSDGYQVDGLTAPNLAVWKGDRVSASIAAASIIAKVTRDRIMIELDKEFGQFGFAGHKGYATAVHQKALLEHGPCEHHRMSYANVQAAREAQL